MLYCDCHNEKQGHYYSKSAKFRTVGFIHVFSNLNLGRLGKEYSAVIRDSIVPPKIAKENRSEKLFPLLKQEIIYTFELLYNPMR